MGLFEEGEVITIGGSCGCGSCSTVYINQIVEQPITEKVMIDSVQKVIFNNPATIVIFEDGTKVVVKTTDGDEFQPEIGFAMAVMKKLFGSRGQYKKFIDKWLPEEVKEGICLCIFCQQEQRFRKAVSEIQAELETYEEGKRVV